jgi:hypothetical protein
MAFSLYTSILDDPSLPDLLFGLLSSASLSDIESQFAVRALLDFVRRHWQTFSVPSRKSLFQSMAAIIISGDVPARWIADAYVELCCFAPADAECYEPPIFEVLNRLPQARDVCHCVAILTLIQFLARKYKFVKPGREASEPTLLLNRVVDTTFGFYGNGELIESVEGCQILEMSLKAFKALFIRCRGSPELLATPIHFCRVLVTEIGNGRFVESRLLARALKVFSCARMKWTKGPCAGEGPGIAELLLQLLHYLANVRCEDDYLVASLLRVLCEFLKFVPSSQGLVDDLMACASLTDQDRREFEANPLLFYSSVYSEWTDQDTAHPRLMARHLLEQLVSESEEVARYLLTRPVDECLLRCLGFFVPIVDSPDFMRDALESVTRSVGNAGPIEAAARVHLLAKCADQFPLAFGESTALAAISSDFIVLKIMGSELLCALVKLGASPSELVVQHLIDFFPTCPTFHAGHALSAITRAAPSLILPRAAFVVDSLLELVQADVSQLASTDANDDHEDALMADLRLLASLVHGSQFVPDALLSLIGFILATDLSEWEGVYDSLGILLRETFLSGAPRTQEILRLLLDSVADRDYLHDFLRVLLEPIQALIGADPSAFVEFGVSEGIIELCTRLTAGGVGDEGIKAVCSLAANVGFADEKAAAQSMALLSACDRTLELAVATAVKQGIPPEPEIVRSITTSFEIGAVDDAVLCRLFTTALRLAAMADPTLVPIVEAVAERSRGLPERPYISVYDRLM